MKRITFLLCFLIASLGFSQVNLVDFETLPPEALDAFEGLGSATVVANPDASTAPYDSALVGQLVVVEAGNPWQGANVIFQSNYIDVTTPASQPVTVDVWADAPFTMLARLADVQGAGTFESAVGVAHGGEGWETLTFVFNNPSDNTTENANGEYGRIAFFPNWTGSGWNDPAIDRTVYIDNITGFEGDEIVLAIPPSGPPTAAPDRAPENVVSIYSDSYTDETTEQREAFGGSIITDIDFSGNSIISATTPGPGAGFQYQYFNANLDLSDFDFAHIDFYVSEQAVLEGSVLILIAQKADGLNIQIAFDLRDFAPNTWHELEVEFDDFAEGSAARDDIRQVIVVNAGPEAVGPIYVDNIYFHNNVLSTDQFDTASFKVFPNPTKNNWNIESSTTISSIAIYDILGKQVRTLTPNASDVEISTENITAGIYFARIDGINGSKTVKLIKE